MIGYQAARAHENGDCWAPTCEACEFEDAQRPRLIVDTDAHGDQCVWDTTSREYPQPVLHKGDVGDEALWAAIVGLVESEGVA